MKIHEVQISSATLKRNCHVEFILSNSNFGRKYSCDMSKDCDRKRLDLLFDYVQETDIRELNDKSVKLVVNDQDTIRTDPIAIGHPSDDRFFLIESTEVVEMSFSDLEKICSESE